MIPRTLTSTVLERLRNFPVVAITGPRQVGKTTLAKFILSKVEKESIYLDLELPSDLNRLRNAEFFLKENEDKLVVIDEVQRRPELFPLLRALIDQKRESARFLILGSASPELLRQSSETLAGRIAYLELPPFHFGELPIQQFQEHWLRGGFPPSLLAKSNQIAFQWLENFSLTFVERELPQLGLNVSSQVLFNLLLMLTSAHGQLLNFNTLSKSMGISMPTVKKYMGYFEAAYFIRYLPPWHANVKKRLVKTPKMYFLDSGILHSLMGISDLNHLLGNQIVGASWEGYIVQQIIANLPERMIPFFYRTKDGSEMDLVLVRGNKPLVAFEVKFSDNPSLSRGNRLAIKDIQAPMNLIITPGDHDYPLEKGIRVCSIGYIHKYLEGK